MVTKWIFVDNDRRSHHGLYVVIINIIPCVQFSDKHKIVLARAAKHCPVGKTLEDNIEENIKFMYPE